jgi:glycerol-3-phosphate O-acyltransferase
MYFPKLLKPFIERGHYSEKVAAILQQFVDCYERVLLSKNLNPKDFEKVIINLLTKVEEQVIQPYAFEPYHAQIRHPFDYYQMGLDFVTPLIDMPHSTLTGIESIHQIRKQIDQGHNVILFSNHQIEADPQVIAAMLQKVDSKLGEAMIAVAGERVLVDPFAAPFSMGLNLLCIYSKKYMDVPPEMKLKKQMHNKKTMELMSEKLSQGGHCIYVAPSGGRDRRNADGILEISPFDPSSVEMFILMAKKAKTPTHFYPLSLATYSVLPPPETTQVELGEKRVTKGGAVHIHFGSEIHFENLVIPDGLDKFEARQWKADYVYNIVKQNYLQFHVEY